MCIIMSPVPILVCRTFFIKRVEDWCKSCVDCAMKKSPNDFSPLLPLQVEAAFDRVAVDILGPFKPSDKVVTF